MVPNWQHIGLVVFDVDGTLYHQKALRFRMALELCKDSIATRDLKTLRILREYRRMRERLADAEKSPFEEELISHVSKRLRISPSEISRIVEEWLESRPLPFLMKVRRAGIAELFSELKRTGRTIAVLSDYPTERKMMALGLEVDLHLSAGDPALEAMKPNSKGLRMLMERAGYSSNQTLMVGDRDERDGEIARREGVAVMILDQAGRRERPNGSLDILSRALGLERAEL